MKHPELTALVVFGALAGFGGAALAESELENEVTKMEEAAEAKASEAEAMAEEQVEKQRKKEEQAKEFEAEEVSGVD